MLKKILSASLIILQILTQSASAIEFQPIIQPVAVQSLQISSDILKNKMPFSGVDDFLFFNISDISVNQPLAYGHGLSVFSGVLDNQTLSNPAGWRLTGAYMRALPQFKIQPLVVILAQSKRDDSSGLLPFSVGMNDKHPEKGVLDVYHFDWSKEGQQNPQRKFDHPSNPHPIRKRA